MKEGTKQQIEEYKVAKIFVNHEKEHNIFYEKGRFSIGRRDMIMAGCGCDMEMKMDEILQFLRLSKRDFFEYLVEVKKNAILGHINAYKQEIKEMENSL